MYIYRVYIYVHLACGIKKGGLAAPFFFFTLRNISSVTPTPIAIPTVEEALQRVIPTTLIANLNQSTTIQALAVLSTLQDNGDLQAIKGNEELTDQLLKLTGLEKTFKSLTPTFSLNNYGPIAKYNMLLGVDVNNMAKLALENALVSTVADTNPAISTETKTQLTGIKIIQDATLAEAMSTDADWITPEVMVALTPSADSVKANFTPGFLTTSLTDITTDTEAAWALRLIDVLPTEDLLIYHSGLINEILKIYPRGLRASYRSGMETAYGDLLAVLDKINPQWYIHSDGGIPIYNMEPYSVATTEALEVFSYDIPHSINSAIMVEMSALP